MWISYTLVDTEIGRIGLVGSTEGLRRIVLPQSSGEAVIQLIMEGLPGAIADPSPFGDLPQRLRRYLRGEPISFDDRLDLTHTTPFRRAVWQAACLIPYGETNSYAWVAEQIGKPRALRAVGQALAKNPIPIVVPCHRVVGKSGDLRGGGRGLDTRKRLLEIEASLKR